MEILGYIIGILLVVLVMGSILTVIGLVCYRMIIWQLKQIPRFKNTEGRHAKHGSHAH
jgi:hypothetical protein